MISTNIKIIIGQSISALFFNLDDRSRFWQKKGRILLHEFGQLGKLIVIGSRLDYTKNEAVLACRYRKQ